MDSEYADYSLLLFLSVKKRHLPFCESTQRKETLSTVGREQF